MTTTQDPRYIQLVEHLASVRHNANITQADLADAFDQAPSWVESAESLARPLEIVELFDWLTAIGYCHKTFFTELGWFTPDEDTPALPLRGEAIGDARGVRVPMVWQGRIKEVLLEGITREGYLWLETEICALYAQLNLPRPKLKNREAVARALELAINKFPRVNASDLFHHIVHRLYLREYTRTQADRSWQRAGIESLEPFVETRYGAKMAKRNIVVRWLARPAERTAAFAALELPAKSARPPLALYGTIRGVEHLFGAIFVRPEDAATARALQEQGYAAYLLTLDAYSAPLPLGDLVNRGELGTPDAPTALRGAIEAGFSACYSYNSRTAAGGRINEASFDPKWDPLPLELDRAWAAFRQTHSL